MRLIELCCGSAALSWFLAGGKAAIVPYQGSKWKYRRELATHCVGQTQVTEYVLCDAGPWGSCVQTVFSKQKRNLLVARLEEMATINPKKCYSLLQHSRVPEDEIEYAAQFLFLQRLAFSGKAVRDPGGRWASPGFNETSAFGKPATDRFGAIHPMLPSLARTLAQSVVDVEVHAQRADATTFSAQLADKTDTVAYIDPPYAGTTQYENKLPRPAVLALIEQWKARGARVVVSEAEPLPLGSSCTHVLFWRGARSESPFHNKTGEWLTIY